MVRFHWHVEDGHGCLVPPGKLSCCQQDGILHAGIEFEIAGQSGSVEALITCPIGYLEYTKDIGVALGHPQDAEEWKGTLMTSLAVCLAKEGYVVVRYYCKQKEQRRQRIFEKALDACATSPFARVLSINCYKLSVVQVLEMDQGWQQLLGRGVEEPMPSNKGGPAPDSRGPLSRLEAPIVFVTPSHDKFCSLMDLKKMEPNMPSKDKRFINMQNLNEDFKPLSGEDMLPRTMSDLCSVCLEYMSVVSAKDFSSCVIPHLNKVECRAEAHVLAPTSQPPVKDPLEQHKYFPAQANQGLPAVASSTQMFPSHPNPCLREQVCGLIHPRIPSSVLPHHYYQLPHLSPHYGFNQSHLGSKKPVEVELHAHESLQGPDEVPCGLGPSLGLSLEVRGFGASAMGSDPVGGTVRPGMLVNHQSGQGMHEREAADNGNRASCQFPVDGDGDGGGEMNGKGAELDGLKPTLEPKVA